MAIRFLINHYLCGAFKAHHASPFTGILHTVAHLPLLALELLFHHHHLQCTEPCAVILNTLVLATCAAALHFHVVRISYAHDSHTIHSLFSLISSAKFAIKNHPTMALFSIVRRIVRLSQNPSDKPSDFLLWALIKALKNCLIRFFLLSWKSRASLTPEGKRRWPQRAKIHWPLTAK